MKNTKQITQFFLIILTGSIINIYSSTNDEPTAEPSESATASGAASTQEGRPRKVLSLKDLAMGKVATQFNPQYIINRVNTYLKASILKDDQLDEAVDYVTGLHLDQNTLIEILNKIETMPKSGKYFKLIHLQNLQFFLLTLTANKQLHNNDAIATLSNKMNDSIIYFMQDKENFGHPQVQLIDDQIKTLIETLIQDNVNVNDTMGTQLLVKAIRKHFNQLALLLLQSGINPNLPDASFDNMDALDRAIQAANPVVVQYLLEHDLIPPIGSEVLKKALFLRENFPYVNQIRVYKLLSQAADKESDSSTSKASSAE